nr:DUF2852 domain-containing protein [uncultured Celeribacter sp.]
MTHTATSLSATDTPMGWLRRIEAWLDDKGKGAWIATMVLSFIFVWPLGLAVLFYMIWGKKMFACKNRQMRHAARNCDSFRAARAATRTSGNAAFDAYKVETLRRLEEEQDQFEAFLERLRAAKDQAEFDQFMEDRSKRRDRDAADTQEAQPQDA